MKESEARSQKREGRTPALVQMLASWLCICLWLGIGSLRAATADALFAEGNNAYGNRDYEQAAALYDSVLAQGLVSPEVYYNLGNAHYKLGHLAEAILNYERALRLDPGYEDAAFNLRLANLKVVDNIQPQPEFVLSRWSRELIDGRSAAQWGYWALALLWLVAGAVAVLFFVPRPQVRRVAFVSGIVLGLASVTCLGLGLVHHQRTQSEQYGLVMTPNAYLKNAPDGDTDLLILHEGVKVKIVDYVGPWTQIKLEGANIGEVVGFVQREAVEVI